MLNREDTSWRCRRHSIPVALAHGPTGRPSPRQYQLLGRLVLDEQRLPISGASPTIQETQSGFKRTMTSSPDGAFEFPGLPPGEYKLIVESTGFQRKELRVPLEVNQQVRLEVVLPVGALTENVDVVASTPLLHTGDAAVGEVVDKEHMAELPLNGRQFLELALVVPGAHTSHGAQSGNSSPLYCRPGQNSAISISGGRPNSNVYLLDGTSNTDPSFNTYVISLAPDMIREFQIQTGTYTAELGGAGTGQVEVVTKSGANQMHGSVYHFFRNSALDARLFTSPSKLPHFSQNQFGGTLGDPVAKDRLFYFFGCEGLRSSQRQSTIMTVPLAAWRQGDFSDGPAIYDPATTQPNPSFDSSKPESPSNPRFLRSQFPGNRIPVERMNPVARAILDQFVPLPNLPGDSNNHLDTRAQLLTSDQINVRFDHAWAGGHSLFGRYSLSQEDGFTPENLPASARFTTIAFRISPSPPSNRSRHSRSTSFALV